MLDLDKDNVIAVSLCQGLMDIKTKNTKRLILSRDTSYDLNHQTVYRLNNHVTVQTQYKVIIRTCGHNIRAVIIPGLSPLLT